MTTLEESIARMEAYAEQCPGYFSRDELFQMAILRKLREISISLRLIEVHTYDAKHK